MEMHGKHDHSEGPARRPLIWAATVVLLLLAAACYWYGTEHRNHIVQAMTWALVLACPLMHLFGHGHHGHRHHSGPPSGAPRA